MPEQTIRFAVGSPQGPRSAVWRLWVPNRSSDIYIARRSMAPRIKVSLHASNRWRVALTRELVESGEAPIGEAEDRAMVRWERPPESMPGLTAAFAVIVPWSEVIDKVLPVPERDGVVFYERPREGEQVSFYVFLTAPDLEAEGWPGQRSMNTTLIGTADLASGEKVWLVARTVEMPAEHRAHLEAFRENAPRPEPIPDAVEDVTVLFAGVDEKGAGWVLDMGLPSEEERFLIDAPGVHGQVLEQGDFGSIVPPER